MHVTRHARVSGVTRGCSGVRPPSTGRALRLDELDAPRVLVLPLRLEQRGTVDVTCWDRPPGLQLPLAQRFFFLGQAEVCPTSYTRVVRRSL